MINIKLNPNKVIVTKTADIGPGLKEHNITWHVSKIGDPEFNYTFRFKSDVEKLLNKKVII